MVVYVLNKNGIPLMPCKPQKARKLLKQGKAKVVRHTPFTVQLKYGSSGYKQPVVLGVDAGSKTVGVSATTEKTELYTAEVELRTDIVNLLSNKRQYRRGRRSRKTRYRKARFNNRKKPDSWLAPSVNHKINSHLKVVDMVHNILPVTRTVIEVTSFDIQKIRNPDIEGIEYQQGDMLGFWNVREYVLFRDGHKCQGKKNCKGKILNVHHIVSRKTGGDRPENLITLCEDCHNAYHIGTLRIKIKKAMPFKDAAFMGIMRWTVYNRLKEKYPSVKLTYGYLTKYNRIKAGLNKSHVVDARVISGNPDARPSDTVYYYKFVRKNR
jgi:hypothetical protein